MKSKNPRPLFSRQTGTCGSLSLLRIYFSSGRRPCGNDSGIYCSRYRKCYPDQINQTSFYAVFKYCGLYFRRLPYVCHLLKGCRNFFHVPAVHEAGYICSMLFIIPGFPFITSGIDLAKLDLRSGLERLTYSIIIVLVATMFAWIMAMLLRLQPQDFTSVNLSNVSRLVLRLIASFCGVFGFSIMFNSSIPMAATAALIGSVANTLRLELVDFTGIPAVAAAFIGALTAGLLASFIKKNNGYPRISLTVPSIVIMVPGLYLYRAFYNFGIMSLTEAVSWFSIAIMIIIALPLGLIFARILTDRTFRYCT